MDAAATSTEFIFSQEIEWEQVAPKLKRKIYGYDDKIMMVKVAFEAGGVGEIHDHHHSQATYVESGVFEMTIGDEVKTLRAGDAFYIPPHVSHGCTCTEAGILIDVFSPMREDFIQVGE
ncbi:cupin domain-containing protein [Pontibacter sp. G13]|uniref:cupin domain-containing protein n=1 Tax=Pontibacter sp. G13 TaxID=3074898 RepID=UPI00288BD510|nr:cupin domain-containing protein [Pontibacter sp. G13]WNJ20475.1 cupin domain-containing protein [Pontibacter sp. G13]